MPSYEFIGDFVTVLLSVDNRSSVRIEPEAETLDPSELLDCLDKHGRNYQFAARWSEREWSALQSLSLKADDFRVVRDAGRISACAALWDQRAFKQTVIRGYAPWLAMARPVVNFAARILGGSRLPIAGSTLAHSFVSQLAVEPGRPDALIALVAKLRMIATGRGIEFLTLGFAANDPRLAMLRRKFRCREYRSRIYVVRWQGLGGSASELDGRCLGPDVDLL